MTFAQPLILHASLWLLCRVPQEAPQEVAELVVHCTQEEPVHRPTMQAVLQLLEAATAAMQREPQPAPPPLPPGRSSQSTMTGSSITQAPAWRIDPKDLEICKNEQGEDIVLGRGGYGQVTYRPQHPTGLCLPERQLAEVFSSSWCNTHIFVPLRHQADGPCLSMIVPVLPS